MLIGKLKKRNGRNLEDLIQSENGKGICMFFGFLALGICCDGRHISSSKAWCGFYNLQC